MLKGVETEIFPLTNEPITNIMHQSMPDALMCALITLNSVDWLQHNSQSDCHLPVSLLLNTLNLIQLYVQTTICRFIWGLTVYKTTTSYSNNWCIFSVEPHTKFSRIANFLSCFVHDWDSKEKKSRGILLLQGHLVNPINYNTLILLYFQIFAIIKITHKIANLAFVFSNYIVK